MTGWHQILAYCHNCLPTQRWRLYEDMKQYGKWKTHVTSLRAHEQSNYDCPICPDVKFSQEAKLTKHLKKIHGFYDNDDRQYTV